jgi:hypothetical protein
MRSDSRPAPDTTVHMIFKNYFWKRVAILFSAMVFPMTMGLSSANDIRVYLLLIGIAPLTLLLSFLMSAVALFVRQRQGRFTEIWQNEFRKISAARTATDSVATNGRNIPQNHVANNYFSHYITLEIPIDASPEEIKKAYRKKISRYHPDKLAQLSPEVRRLAEEQTLALNRAYSELRKQVS